MLDEIRQAAARQRRARTLRALTLGSRRLLTGGGEMNGMATAQALIGRLDAADADDLGAFFDVLARELGPDPRRVLQLSLIHISEPTRPY